MLWNNAIYLLNKVCSYTSNGSSLHLSMYFSQFNWHPSPF